MAIQLTDIDPADQPVVTSLRHELGVFIERPTHRTGRALDQWLEQWIAAHPAFAARYVVAVRLVRGEVYLLVERRAEPLPTSASGPAVP